MIRGEYFNPEKIDLTTISFTQELLRCIPAQVARHYRVLPVYDETPTSLSIALADPGDLDVVDGISCVLQRDLVVLVADSQQLDEFIQRLYGDSEI